LSSVIALNSTSVSAMAWAEEERRAEEVARAQQKAVEAQWKAAPKVKQMPGQAEHQDTRSCCLGGQKKNIQRHDAAFLRAKSEFAQFKKFLRTSTKSFEIPMRLFINSWKP